MKCQRYECPHPHSRTLSAEHSYGLGWIRTQLSGSAGLMGDITLVRTLDEFPVLGAGQNSRLCCIIRDPLPDTTLPLLPESESLVVLLNNFIDMSDAAALIAQSVLQTMFDSQTPRD